MTVDLNICVPGQLVELRNGNVGEYIRKIETRKTEYPHIIGGDSYTDDGYYYSRVSEDGNDVVKIFPLTKPKQPKPGEHPSVVWWESCPWITNRKPTEKDGDNMGQVMIQQSISHKNLSFMQLEYVTLSHCWIHTLKWSPSVLTDKEQALELLNKHEGGWCPTPKEWTIIRKGLEE